MGIGKYEIFNGKPLHTGTWKLHNLWRIILEKSEGGFNLWKNNNLFELTQYRNTYNVLGKIVLPRWMTLL